MTDRDDDSGLGFRLPPIRLPPFFPKDFEIAFPIPGKPRSAEVSTGVVFAACVFFDVADAVLALVAGDAIGAVRTVSGTFLASMVAGPLGVLYAWEFAAVLLGANWATAVPSLTLLLVLHSLRGVR